MIRISLTLEQHGGLEAPILCAVENPSPACGAPSSIQVLHICCSASSESTNHKPCSTVAFKNLHVRHSCRHPENPWVVFSKGSSYRDTGGTGPRISRTHALHRVNEVSRVSVFFSICTARICDANQPPGSQQDTISTP